MKPQNRTFSKILVFILFFRLLLMKNLTLLCSLLQKLVQFIHFVIIILKLINIKPWIFLCQYIFNFKSIFNFHLFCIYTFIIIISSLLSDNVNFPSILLIYFLFISLYVVVFYFNLSIHICVFDIFSSAFNQYAS